MAAKADTDLFVGLVLIVIGVLVATGPLGLGPLVQIAAVVAIIVGVLILLNALKGSSTAAVALIVVGALVLGVGAVAQAFATVVNIVVGVVLIVAGAAKLQHKW